MSYDYDRWFPRLSDSQYHEWYIRLTTGNPFTNANPRIVHTVRYEQYGGVVVSDCGIEFKPNGTNVAFKSLEAEFGYTFPWRECKTCAKKVGHFDWTVRS